MMKRFLIAVLVHAMSTSALRLAVPAKMEEGNDLAVCVTGQMERLEYESKMENLLKVADKEGRKVDVFLVLQTGKPQYGGYRPPSLLKLTKEDFDLFGKERFGNFYHSGSAHEFQDYTQFANDSKFFEHFPHYRKDLKTSERLRRFSLHMNQFAGWSQCMALVKQAEKQKGRQYDILFKMRDNTIVVNDNISFHFESKRVITTKACSNWGGINDKVAILPREYAEDYMEGPPKLIEEVCMKDSKEERNYANSEQLLHACISHVPSIKVSSDQLPLVDGRPVTNPHNTHDAITGFHHISSIIPLNTPFCLVSAGKDCHPATFAENMKHVKTCR